MTYSGHYLRRSSAERAFRTCHRRGWEPTLGRRFGVWVVSVVQPDVVTWARFELSPAEPSVITERLDEIRKWRQAHQPLGLPSAGSVFRNPEGDHAGSRSWRQ